MQEENYYGEDYRYEIWGENRKDIIGYGFVSLEAAIEYAIKYGGYSIDQVLYPLDENGEIEQDGDFITSQTVWEREQKTGRDKVRIYEFNKTSAKGEQELVAIYHEDLTAKMEAAVAMDMYPAPSRYSGKVIIVTKEQFENVFLNDTLETESVEW